MKFQNSECVSNTGNVTHTACSDCGSLTAVSLTRLFIADDPMETNALPAIHLLCGCCAEHRSICTVPVQ